VASCQLEVRKRDLGGDVPADAPTHRLKHCASVSTRGRECPKMHRGRKERAMNSVAHVASQGPDGMPGRAYRRDTTTACVHVCVSRDRSHKAYMHIPHAAQTHSTQLPTPPSWPPSELDRRCRGARCERGVCQPTPTGVWTDESISPPHPSLLSSKNEHSIGRKGVARRGVASTETTTPHEDGLLHAERLMHERGTHAHTHTRTPLRARSLQSADGA
jgi:hypothetical protein